METFIIPTKYKVILFFHKPWLRKFNKKLLLIL